MCEICNRCQFAIETIEALYPINELKPLYLVNKPVNLTEEEWLVAKENLTAGSVSDKMIYANFAAKLAVQWALQLGIHPEDFYSLFMGHFNNEYCKETARRLYTSITGQPPLPDGHEIKRRGDYES